MRELEEEWSVTPERSPPRRSCAFPGRNGLFVGLAHLPAGAEVVPDAEHDAFEWWPADIADWPEQADEPLRRMASLLASTQGSR